MHLHEHETLKPCSHMQQEPHSLQESPAPCFEMKSVLLSLTATDCTTNILLLLPEQGRSKQLLSQWREEKQQEGQPNRTLFQMPAVVLCCNLCQVEFRKTETANFKVYSPYPPSPQLPSVQQAPAGCKVKLDSVSAGHSLPHWPNANLKHAMSRAAEAAVGELERSLSVCLVSALTIRCNCS